MLYSHTGWRRSIGCFKLQAFLAKEPLIIGLFCGKWSMKIRRPVTLRHPVHTHEYVDERYILVNMSYNICIQLYMRMWHVTHIMLYDIFTFICVSSTYSVIQNILYDRYTWECVMSHIKVRYRSRDVTNQTYELDYTYECITAYIDVIHHRSWTYICAYMYMYASIFFVWLYIYTCIHLYMYMSKYHVTLKKIDTSTHHSTHIHQYTSASWSTHQHINVS